MTVLKSFCGCSSLRTGSIVAVIGGILLAIIGIILLYTAHVDFRTILLDWLPNWIVKIIIVINFAMTIFISVLLLIGIIKRNMYLMLPWVILAIFLAIGILISVIYTSYVLIADDGDTQNGIYWLVFGLISVVIYMYFWLVVYSFYEIVREECKERAAYERAPFRRQFK